MCDANSGDACGRKKGSQALDRQTLRDAFIPHDPAVDENER